MSSEVYSILELEKCDTDINTLLFALEDERRSIRCLQYLIEKKHSLSNIIILQYGTASLPTEIETAVKEINLITLDVTDNPVDFVTALRGLEDTLWEGNVFADISCIKIPEMFSIMKYFKISNNKIKLSVVYSIPYDYNFSNEPFTSYKSYVGDLTTYELLGYSGISGEKENDLFLFMGFEGAMALKITEDTAYNSLILVNNSPSFFPKYKDISVINNYQLMANQKNNLYYTPADNPYETYNLLDESISKDNGACIAPLSTKLVALGACLYALDNENVRVVYPVSRNYTLANTVEIYKSFVYSVDLSQ